MTEPLTRSRLALALLVSLLLHLLLADLVWMALVLSAADALSRRAEAPATTPELSLEPSA